MSHSTKCLKKFLIQTVPKMSQSKCLNKCFTQNVSIKCPTQNISKNVSFNKCLTQNVSKIVSFNMFQKMSVCLQVCDLLPPWHQQGAISGNCTAAFCIEILKKIVIAALFSFMTFKEVYSKHTKDKRLRSWRPQPSVVNHLCLLYLIGGRRAFIRPESRLTLG